MKRFRSIAAFRRHRYTTYARTSLRGPRNRHTRRQVRKWFYQRSPDRSRR